MLEKLKERKKWLSEELQQVESIITKLQAKDEETLKIWGVKVGSVVRDFSTGKEHRVTAYYLSKGLNQFDIHINPILSGNPRNKDGNFGKAIRCLGSSNWELVQ